MIKVGDQVIITRVDRDDIRLGLHADMLCTVKAVHPNTVTVEPINMDDYRLLTHDQVRKF